MLCHNQFGHAHHSPAAHRCPRQIACGATNFAEVEVEEVEEAEKFVVRRLRGAAPMSR